MQASCNTSGQRFKVYYLPTNAQVIVFCLKNNIKIYVKILKYYFNKVYL